jgi:prepilin-type N-terminal cleavage/methylation domain-containing protein
MNMTKRNGKRRVARSAGFTLIEIMLAAMILGVGLLMLLPAFTVGVVESSQMVDASLAAQTAQTGEAYCLTLLLNNDQNFVGAANPNGSPSIYDFTKANAIVNDANIRVQGDPTLSRYYWSMLYRVNQAGAVAPTLVDLWVLACKRDVGGIGNPPPGAMTPVSVGVSGSAGSKTISSAPAALQVPDTYVVTNTGEVLRISGVNGGTLTVNPAITTAFTTVYYVPNSATPPVNACLFAISTKKAF